MRIWVMVRKVGGKYEKIYLDKYEITGKPEVEFVWIGDELSENDLGFLEDCVEGKTEVAEHLDRFNWSGTEFQESVWKKICDIPRGEAWSYGEIAEEIGRPRSFRAVANACSRNPFAFVIPCHRVVASGGKLGGYFYDLKLKEVLLVWEGM